MDKYIQLLTQHFGKTLHSDFDNDIMGVEMFLFKLNANEFYNAIVLLLDNDFPKECYHHLIYASIRLNDIKAVKILLSYGAYLDAFDFSSAVIWCDLSLLELLLESESNLNPESDLSLALFTAVENGYYDKVFKLLQYDIPVECYKLPLLTGIKYNHYEIVKLLIESGVNINFGDEKNSLSHIYCNLNIGVDTRKNLNIGVDTSKIEKNLPLNIAISLGNNDMVNLLLKYGAIIDSSVNQGFIIACQLNHFNTIKLVLDAGYDIINDDMALGICVACDNVDVIKLFMGYGVTIDHDIDWAFSSDTHQNYEYECLTLLFDHGYVLKFETANIIIQKCIDNNSYSSLDLILCHMETNGMATPSLLKTKYEDPELKKICGNHSIVLRKYSQQSCEYLP
ncbi:putative ankyrin repeat protein [Tupanvirus deep ocean]|uniref:Ankyrin repeat protein n=2 Tax=Tupanvirus TaxID=2094720 RepID=A0AC62A6T1_9VIRU|nr:putative ankyrin repeat protein [Tupanvirus deep ocean]QKU33457.1 putative ankyrin repeat protein [Tupanvirus deep ocean]